MTKRRLSALVLLLSCVGLAAPSWAESWVCRQDDLVREVTVDYRMAPSPLPCSVYYTKRTESAMPRPIWQATNEAGYCERKAEELVEKLESWGWQCSVDGASDESAVPSGDLAQ